MKALRVFAPKSREDLSHLIQLGIARVEAFSCFRADLHEMSADTDTQLVQPLLTQTAGDTQRCRQPAGKMAAAGSILEAAVLDLGGVVPMAGSGAVL